MRIIASTGNFFKEVGIALKEIYREIKKALAQRKGITVPNEQYLKFSNEVELILEDIINRGEELGKTALELAQQEGLIDKDGFVTSKGKSLGVTSAMVKPFNYKPTVLN